MSFGERIIDRTDRTNHVISHSVETLHVAGYFVLKIWVSGDLAIRFQQRTDRGPIILSVVKFMQTFIVNYRCNLLTTASSL